MASTKVARKGAARDAKPVFTSVQKHAKPKAAVAEPEPIAAPANPLELLAPGRLANAARQAIDADDASGADDANGAADDANAPAAAPSANPLLRLAPRTKPTRARRCTTYRRCAD